MIYPLRAFKFTHISGNDYKVEWIHLNSDLSVQRTIERSASSNLYLINTDSLTLDHWGNSYYSKWDTDDRRVNKHDNDGEFVWEHFDLGADENTRGLCIAKDGYLLMLKQDVGDTANVRRIPLDKSTSLGSKNLTSGKAYFGMALDFSLESEGIYTFYTFNQTDGKIEKRDWLSGDLLAELGVSGESFGTLSSWDFKLVGDTLMWFTSSTAGMVAMTNKNLEGSVTYNDYITTPDATNIQSRRWLASIEDDYFILTANGTYDIPDGEGGFDEVEFSKIWKIDSAGNAISETDKPLDEYWQFFDVPQWNGKDEATIQALTPEKTNNDPLTVNFKGNVTDVGVGNGYKRGIEFYDVDKEEGEWGSITYPYDEYETAMTYPQVWRGYPAEEFNFEIYWYVEENKNYKVRAYFDNAYGRTYSEYIDFSTLPTELTTISAERISAYANIKLTGEVTDGGESLTKRGFEYIIQDTEPAEGDSGTEVLEDEEVEGEGFANEQYNIYTGDELRTLYNLDNDKEDWEATTIWWFRAIGYSGAIKFYGDWIKNIPTVTTGAMDNQLALNSIPMVNAHGELTDKGANDVTERGFRIIKEYQGNLLNADFYIAIGFGDFSIMVEMESHTVLGGDDGYTVIDYYWTGTFYRDSVEEGDFDLEEFERTLGGGISFEGLGIYLKPSDTYKIQAMAKNDLGWAFGEQLEVTTLEGTSIDLDDDKIDSNKFEKTVTLGTVPSGCEVTRIGIRLGRTKGCNELHYFQDGSWGSGESITFMVELEPDSTYYIMPYIVIDYGDYEEEILGMLDYTDPDMEDEYLSNFPVEVTDDIEEDEENILTTNAQAGQGNYGYRSINKKINCEKIGHQGLIDYYGRRRAYTVNNHLIQNKEVCYVIINSYLDKFQRLKLKVAIDIDMPIPFEEQDVVLLGDGKTLFKADTQGAVLFKADGEGEIEQQSFILAKIRKLGATYESGGSTIIPIELEV